MTNGPASSRRLVRVLEVDPDLARALDEVDVIDATRQTIGVLETVEPGPWRPRSINEGKFLYGGVVFGGVRVRELSGGGSPAGGGRGPPGGPPGPRGGGPPSPPPPPHGAPLLPPPGGGGPPP